MAKRRQQRQGKSKGLPNPFADLPTVNLDDLPPIDLDISKSETEEPIKVNDPTAAAEMAKELLKAQRNSVNMLTMVRERIIERLSDSIVRTELDDKGFAIVDNMFLFGTTNDEKILAELQEEGTRMLQEGGMEVDTTNLGTGEYIIPIVGGEKQYVTCPRMVEIVVSATKHVPEVFNCDNNEESFNKCLDLNPSACMATLRTFDRKALKASMALLMGKEDDHVLDNPESTSPLKMIANSDDDHRKLSLYYYIVPDTWDKSCGGGLEFESGVANAKRDRLVVFYSDKTKCKAIAWKGSDDSTATMVGNSIELHLVNNKK